MNILTKLRALLHYLMVSREYKEVDGIPYIRERGKDWEPLLDHLKRMHPEAYESIQKDEDRRD